MFTLLERVDPQPNPESVIPQAPSAKTGSRFDAPPLPTFDWHADEPVATPPLADETRFMLEANRDILNATRDKPASIASDKREAIMTGLGFTLPHFPDYTFAEDGTPTRVSFRSSGPKPTLGEIRPVRSNGRSRYFSLTGPEGRVTITDSRIRDMLAGKADNPTDFFSLDDFPKNYFDATGSAYRIRDRKPNVFEARPTRSGGIIRQYRLLSISRGDYVKITDSVIRRMRDGRCSLYSCDPPEGAVLMGEEFPDWAIDTFTGQPYRIASASQAVYEPYALQIRPTGCYCLYDYAGNRHLLSPDKLLAYIGSPNA